MSAFVMPSLGADMESAVLMEWKVKEGDRVEKGQVIAEVETSKGVIEIEVFETGTVEKLLVEPETECAVGSPMAMIRAEGEAAPETEVPAETEAPEPEEKPAIPEVKPAEEVKEPESTAPAAEKAPAEAVPAPKPAERKVPAEGERVKASPAARKRAEELGVDLSGLTPGAGGAIHLEQVEAAAGGAPEAPKVAERKAPEPSAMRQAIAAAMSRANAEIPHYYLSTPINMTPALAWLEKLNAGRSIEKRVLPAALMIRAVVKALQEVPELNGFWEEGEQRVSEAIHPGIAIALRKGGLITPALLDAQAMDLEATMAALSDLITRTRAGRLRGAEMTQQTVTITNLGDLGVERVYGVIYPPQVALVGLGRISDAPWAEGDALSGRKVMHATLAGDHRATDGRTGALFLDHLNRLLENPEALL
jgi:pyruvate dehydrogenase E2 component (dihydrolipoamide acetyltransferase)